MSRQRVQTCGDTQAFSSLSHFPWVSEELHKPNHQDHTVSRHDVTPLSSTWDKSEGHAHQRRGGREAPRGERQNHQNRNCGWKSCCAICHNYCCAPMRIVLPVGLRETMPWSTKKGKQGCIWHSSLGHWSWRITLHRALKTVLLNHPWYPRRKGK